MQKMFQRQCESTRLDEIWLKVNKMTMNDTVANALNTLKNAEKSTKSECLLKPSSKLIGRILEVLKSNNYIKEFELVDDGKSGIFRVQLLGAINECKAIKPRQPVKKNEIEKFEKRFLPSRDIGLLIITTPHGIMSHKDAKEKSTGGRVLAYVY